VNDGGFVFALVVFEDFVGGRAAPLVDGLINVAEEAELVMVLGEEVEDAVFRPGGVLDFVDLDPIVAGAPPVEAFLVLFKECDDAEDEVGEVDGVGVAEHGDVVLQEGGEVEVWSFVGGPEAALLEGLIEDFAGLAV